MPCWVVWKKSNPRHISRYGGVGCVYSPQSHSGLCSWGFTYLPPCPDAKSLEDLEYEFVGRIRRKLSSGNTIAYRNTTFVSGIQTPIYVQTGAGNLPSRWACQKRHRRSNILRCSIMPCSNKLPLGFCLLAICWVHITVSWARMDKINGNTPWAEIASQATG